ncbi:hypothetical protein [Janibacter sp. Soil728]|uniref:hypothetical protein n=1 Tax=Janibacter sp. Soil728 TaxID=1736393 RepID=UPI0012E774D4|nr:hypothetical protein [Janibacter sp. Soil728]
MIREADGLFGPERWYVEHETHDEDDGYDQQAARGGLGELTEIVVIDGHVVESCRRPISGSGYECAALELDHLRGRAPAPIVQRVEVRVPPHEAMLDWLTRVVGGERPLAELDAQPLPASSPVDVGGFPDQERELAQAVDEQLARASAGWLVTDEVLTACRRLLTAAATAGTLRLWRDLEPAKVAAVVVHCIVKANGLAGAGAPFTVAHWLRDLGTTQAPSSRSATLATTIGGSRWAHGQTPTEVPDVYVLGDAGMLVSRFRRELMDYRDLAVRIREE